MNNCGLVYSGGVTYVVTRLRSMWVLLRGTAIIALEISPESSLDEAKRFAELQLRAW